MGGIQAINPSLVHIYAQSYGTYALNTYMQLPGARADVIVLDGQVPPNRWPLENNAGNNFICSLEEVHVTSIIGIEWALQVAQDVAYGCVSNSSVYSARLSVMGHIPKSTARCLACEI